MNTTKWRMVYKYNLFITIFISSLLLACNSEGVIKDDKEVYVTFRGTIIEINGHRAIVYSKGYARTLVDLSVNSTVTFQVGDKMKLVSMVKLRSRTLLELLPFQLN